MRVYSSFNSQNRLNIIEKSTLQKYHQHIFYKLCVEH